MKKGLLGGTLRCHQETSTKEARFTCCTPDSISVESASTSACWPMTESISISSPSPPTSTR